LNTLKKYNHSEPLYKPVLRELFISEDSEEAYRMALPIAENIFISALSIKDIKF